VLRQLSSRCHTLPVGEEYAALDEEGSAAEGGGAVEVAPELAGFDCVVSRVLRALAGLAGGFLGLSVCFLFSRGVLLSCVLLAPLRAHHTSSEVGSSLSRGE
jgi:hypothetical protein